MRFAQIGAGHSRRCLGDQIEGSSRLPIGFILGWCARQNRAAALSCRGRGTNTLRSKTARAASARHPDPPGPIGRGDDYHAFVALEAVHGGEQGVDGLLVLAV